MLSSKTDSPTLSGSGLSLAQLARARSYSYRLFSQLYLQGITTVSLPYLQQIPDLTAVLPHPFNADTAAASHHALFQFNVFAFESFFLSEDGLVGGGKTAVVAQHYAQYANSPGAADTEADHLGHQLAFLAFLTAEEAEAWESDQLHTARERQAAQQQFLQDHLLRWAIPCLLAVQAQPDPFFAELARLTQALVLEHFEVVAKTAVSAPANFLPPPHNILANDKTGFKEIAHFLLLPALSGIYLSRDSIGQLGRQFELPRGFGSREQMLLNLLRTAVQYEILPQLLAELGETAVQWQTNYQTLSQSYPKAAPFLQPWQVQAQNSQQLLAAISSQATLGSES